MPLKKHTNISSLKYLCVRRVCFRLMFRAAELTVWSLTRMLCHTFVFQVSANKNVQELLI